MSNDILLKRALYRRYPEPVAADETPIASVSRWLCAELAQGIERITEGLQPEDVAAHLTCSTILDTAFSGHALDWQQMRSQIGEQTRFVPDSMINAYECACWGYCLRYLIGREKKTPYVIVNIVDINVFNLTAWMENENWGKSGFGIASLLFEVGDATPDLVKVGAGKTHTHVAEFAMDLRKTLVNHQQVPVALPFFPKHVTDALHRMLPGVPRLTDLHPRFGHCFGSDPWLAIIDDMAVNGRRDQRYLASSVALNGYWTIANVSTRADGWYRFEEVTQ